MMSSDCLKQTQMKLDQKVLNRDSMPGDRQRSVQISTTRPFSVVFNALADNPFGKRIMKTAISFSWLLFGVMIAADPVFAQHHHHHPTPWYNTTTIYDPHGHRVTANYDQYAYVIPASQQYTSTYYTNNNVRYYHDHHGGQVQRPTAMVFGAFSHSDELATRLEVLANEFCLDLHYNYRHNPGFAETYREAYNILQYSKDIHSEEHRGHKEDLMSLISKLDPLFHHVEEDVRTWSRDHHRQIGNLGIIDKMQQMESVIHHLLYDAGVEPQHHGDHGQEQAPPPGGGPEVAPPPAP